MNSLELLAAAGSSRQLLVVGWCRASLVTDALGFAAREDQGRAVGPGQDTEIDDDGPHLVRLAAIQPRLRFEHGLAHELLAQVAEDILDVGLALFIQLLAVLLLERLEDLVAQGPLGVAAFMLALDGKRFLQLALGKLLARR